MPTTVEDQKIQQLEQQLSDSANQVRTQGERIQELGSYQSEARNLRDANATLQAKVDELQASNEALTREANQARSQAAAVSSVSSNVDAKVAAAKKLAEALKVLSA